MTNQFGLQPVFSLTRSFGHARRLTVVLALMAAVPVASWPIRASAGEIPRFVTQEPVAVVEAVEESVDDEASSVPLDGLLPTDRAWEYSHYRVRLWISSDGSVAANNLLNGFSDEVRRLAELCDPSGWELLPVDAPAAWRWKCLNGIAEPTVGLKEIGRTPELKFDDKLMIVNFSATTTGIRCQVRELDLTTNQWGALVESSVDQTGQAGQVAFSMIRTAFMPLARIDRVTQDNEVYMRVKGANLCHIVVFNQEQQAWTVQLNTGSPVMVQPNDFLIPVLRKTDRDNKLLSQDPVELTYIMVDPAGPPKVLENIPVKKVESGEATGSETAASEGGQGETVPTETPANNQPEQYANGDSVILGENRADLFGWVQSSFRAPLVARKSKRLEKLALVIRPPSGTTVLQLTAADATKQPMEGIEIWSRPLNAEKDDRSEFLGKTDWRGMLGIPPSPEGLRMIYLKRGARALRKLPIMPGLYPKVETTIVNDEARLFSEGVISGMGNEIIDVLAQRQIYEMMIGEYLAGDNPTRENIAKASEELKKYSELPKFQQLRARMSDEKSRLQAQSSDKREEDFINKMFESLESVLTKFLGESPESDLRRRIQSLQTLDEPAAKAAEPAAKAAEPAAKAAEPAAQPAEPAAKAADSSQ